MVVEEAQGQGSLQVAESRRTLQGVVQQADRKVAWVQKTEQQKHAARHQHGEGHREVQDPFFLAAQSMQALWSSDAHGVLHACADPDPSQL
jgi:hypothetical protein